MQRTACRWGKGRSWETSEEATAMTQVGKDDAWAGVAAREVMESDSGSMLKEEPAGGDG